MVAADEEEGRRRRYCILATLGGKMKKTLSKMFECLFFSALLFAWGTPARAASILTFAIVNAGVNSGLKQASTKAVAALLIL
jgi:SNF family Na+-dependent transporter